MSNRLVLRKYLLDGGPRPDLAHAVTPGIDFEFINNYFVPYEP